MITSIHIKPLRHEFSRPQADHKIRVIGFNRFRVTHTIRSRKVPLHFTLLMKPASWTWKRRRIYNESDNREKKIRIEGSLPSVEHPPPVDLQFDTFLSVDKDN